MTGKLIIIGFLTILVLLAVIGGVSKSSEQADKCKAAGGIPQSERGVYKACMKPDNFIKIN